MYLQSVSQGLREWSRLELQRNRNQAIKEFSSRVSIFIDAITHGA